MSKALSLVLNIGSSSVKYAVYRASAAGAKPTWDLLVDGLAEGIGTDDQSRIKHVCSEEGKSTHSIPLPDHRAALTSAIGLLPEEYKSNIGSIGHRVVHGGEGFSNAALVDDTVREAIKEAGALAPLHNPWYESESTTEPNPSHSKHPE
jgi:acetate kinase